MNYDESISGADKQELYGSFPPHVEEALSNDAELSAYRDEISAISAALDQYHAEPVGLTAPQIAAPKAPVGSLKLLVAVVGLVIALTVLAFSVFATIGPTEPTPSGAALPPDLREDADPEECISPLLQAVE